MAIWRLKRDRFGKLLRIMFPALLWASITRSSEDLIKTKVVISYQELNVTLRSEADTQPGGSQSNISE